MSRSISSEWEGVLEQWTDEALRALVRASPLAIIAHEPDGTILLWNPAAERIFGWTAEEVLGRHIPFVPEARMEEHRALLERALSGETLTGLDLDRVRSDGSPVEVSLSTAPMRDLRGEVVAVMGVLEDVTERRREQRERAELLEREREARAAAEEANRAKANFLAVMSHELRTPLTAIMGYAELLMMGVPEPIPEASGQQVERIQQASRHLLGLIEEILSFSDLETARGSLRREPVDLREAAEAAVSSIGPLAEEKALAIRVEGEPSVPLVTDRERLRQVMVHVLSNAVKFTAEGEVRVEVGRDGGSALLRVRDTGIGIRPEDMERVFDAFWQAEQSSTRKAEGTGLGLTLARRITQLLGGELHLESTPGEGTAVTLRLPLHPEERRG